MVEVNIKHTIRAGDVKRYLQGSNGVRRGLLVRGLAVQTEAKKRLNEAPRRIDTGRLRNSIVIQESVKSGVPVVLVGTNVFYAPFIHGGVQPHLIVPRNASVLAWQGPNGMIFARSVMHPGFPANPFLTDGLIRGMAKFNG